MSRAGIVDQEMSTNAEHRLGHNRLFVAEIPKICFCDTDNVPIMHFGISPVAMDSLSK